jgi:hypothetical protein
MDLLGWLGWLAQALFGLLWFLIGGWVSTLAQIVVLVAIVFFYKYGWQRAPLELAARLSAFGRFVWAWLRQREPGPQVARTRGEVREVVRTVRVKEAGDVNVSTLLSLLAAAGLLALAWL